MSRWESKDGSYIVIFVFGKQTTMQWKHSTDQAERGATYTLADEQSAADLAVVLAQGIPADYREVG